jgi:hypothetical protein
MENEEMGKVEGETYALRTVIFVVFIGLLIVLIYLSKNNRTLAGLYPLFSGYMWAMGIVAGLYSFIRVIPTAKPRHGKLKTGFLKFFCGCGVVISVMALWAAFQLPKAACIADRALVRQLCHAFPDSVAAYINQLPADNRDDDYQSVLSKAQEFRKEGLSKAMDGAGIQAGCRSCYLYLLDSVQTDTLAVLCNRLDTLNAISAALQRLIRDGNIQVIPGWLREHHIPPGARILKSINNEFVMIGHIEAYLKDMLQLNKPARLRPIWRNAAGGGGQEDMALDFIVES